MRWFARVGPAAALSFAALAGGPFRAAADDTEAAIRAELAQWTKDFNAGRADRVCDLFARDLRYDFRGFPERGYDDICTLLTRSLADKSRSFTYALDVREVVVSGDIAIVRLTWTLTLTRTDEPGAIVTTEPGLDVFRRGDDGRWRIIRYMAYDGDPMRQP
jgi:steroid delta-isomerase